MSQDTEQGFGERLSRAQAGDPRAFDELIAWLERPLLGFLYSRKADDAEGMANEVLVRAFRGIQGFEGGRAQFRAWVFRIARNMLVDEHRYRGRRPDLVPMVPDLLPDGAAADDPMDRVGERERVEEMLTDLTEEQREVLLLRVVAELSVEETAEVVGRRPGAVRSLQHRALIRLRASLAGGVVT